jgi:hypothetical protein
MTKVYDKNGKEFTVDHKIDVKGWLDAGYTIENPKEDSGELDREALVIEAEQLGIKFPPKMGAKKLFELIEAKKLELAGNE